jgi:4-amino-4-deoxy-L-arabinose transferase-like glycosyltransferase
VASVYLLTAAGRFANYDAESMFAVTRSLYERGSLDVGPCEAGIVSIACVRGADGRYYSGYGVVPSIAALPFYAVGRVAGKAAELNTDFTASASVSLMNSLVGALACVALFLWAPRVGCTVRQSLAVAILLAFATPLWFHSTKEFYSEPLFTLFLVGCFAALSRNNRNAVVAAGLLFGLAVGTRVFGLIYLPIAAAYAVLVSRRRESTWTFAAWFLVAVLVCLVGVGILNQTRFGSPFNTGYHVALPTLSSAFSTPLPAGLWGNLFDGDVGLVWFAPLVLLLPLTWPHFHREHRLESFVCLAVVATSLVFFSGYTYWRGGWSYGPRLLVPILPFLIFPLTPMFSKASARASTTFGRLALVFIPIAMAIQLIGIIPPYSRQYYLRPFYAAEDPVRWWHTSLLLKNLEDLPVVMSYVSPRRSGGQTVRSAIGMGARTSGATISVHGDKDRYLLSFPNSINQLAPDIWWLKAAALGAPWRVLAPAVLLLCLCAAAAAYRLGRINA